MEQRSKKICFVGAPSTGKTTLARHIAAELIKNNYSAEMVGEFVRDYLIENGPIKNPIEQISIAKGQKEKERMAFSHNPEFIVCDAASFLSQVYFDFLKDKVFNKNEELENAAQALRQEIGTEVNSYDFVFFLPPEIPVQEDGVRLYTDDIKEISDRIQKFLNLHNIKYHELRGDIEERANQAFKIIL